MNLIILFELVLAHVVGDFYCQTDKSCQEKLQRKFKSKSLYFHSLVIALLSWDMVGGSLGFFPYFILLWGSHILIDWGKTIVEPSQKKRTPIFIADQILHLCVMVVIAVQFSSEWSNKFYELFNVGHLHLFPILLTILLLSKPTNILIKLILSDYHIMDSNTRSCSQTREAGALIGSLERLLTLCFVLLGEFEAIGFIIAAKSILRFKDNERPKTEYVLAGTLLSFGIAILMGILLKYKYIYLY